MGYNMACYACQLGNQDEARHWLELHIDAGTKAKSEKWLELIPIWRH